MEKRSLIRQVFLFGIVGTFASLTHFLMVMLLVENQLLMAEIANIIAFLCAYPVSFFGHSYLTFAQEQHNKRTSFMRFFLVAVFGLFLNESGYLLLLNYTSMHYLVSLIIILVIVPLITFIFSKFWAFKN